MKVAEPFAQKVLLHLADRVAREVLREDTRFGCLESREAVAQRVEHRLFVHCGTGLEHHDGPSPSPKSGWAMLTTALSATSSS